MSGDSLPIHFLTVVHNGEPFLRYPIDVFRRLPFRWHWHIVEGVAELKHDTVWSVAAGGHIADGCHRAGKSNDGSTEYLDELQARYPDRVTVYRKPNGAFWDGKTEMVNAPLDQIREDCLLWQLDADELWTAEQIATARQLFLDHPEKTAAYYWCWYFVGERLVISTRNCYSQNPRVEWLRTWRFRPGMRWSSHEPPRLVERVEGPEGDLVNVNVGALAPFTHAETEAAGLVFQHFAYVTTEQLLFKEHYYGYHNAFVQWHELQRQTEFPRLLRRHLAWVKDHTEVDTYQNLGVVPLARKVGNAWQFDTASGEHQPPGKSISDSLDTQGAYVPRSPDHPRFVVDGVFFQLAQSGIARLWRSLLEEWVKSGFARQVTVLDRGGRVPAIPGICRRPFPPYDCSSSGRDAYLVQQVCDEEKAGAFISSYYTTPLETPSVFLAYDMIPESLAADRSQPIWREKHHAILHASSYLAISKNTAADLRRFYPHVSAVTVAYPEISPEFRPAEPDEVESLRKKYRIARPYFLVVGDRCGFNGYKNVARFLQAFAEFPGREKLAIVCAGNRPKLEEELVPVARNLPVSLFRLTDVELRAAYSGAVALVYPSLSEGFGLPVAEAMACGCPVITCRNSSLPEVAAEAALYVTGTDPQEFMQAFQSVREPGTRTRLIAAGLERARLFSQSTLADSVARHLVEIAGQERASANALTWAALRKLQAESQGIGLGLQVARLTQRVGQLLQSEWELLAIKASRFWKLRRAWHWSKRALGACKMAEGEPPGLSRRG